MRKLNYESVTDSRKEIERLLSQAGIHVDPIDRIHDLFKLTRGRVRITFVGLPGNTYTFSLLRRSSFLYWRAENQLYAEIIGILAKQPGTATNCPIPPP